MAKNPDQRAAPRFRCRCYASIDAIGDSTEQQTEQSWPAHLINLSEKGALVAVLQDHAFTPGKSLTISIELDDQVLEFQGEIAHVREHYIGIKCGGMPKKDALKIKNLLETINS